MKKWMQIVRAQYLVLCLVLSVVGNSIAWFHGQFQWSIAILSLMGLLLAHMSVNVLNDYFDHKSGLDQQTTRTPFNGGSGSIQEGIITPKQTLWVGVILLFIAAGIGAYFVFTIHWMLLPLLIVAGLFVVFYTPFFLQHLGAEWIAGIGLGALPVIGTYFVQTGQYSLLIFLASIPSTILVHNLLLINEFPDHDADAITHRKTLPILFGKEATSRYYQVVLILLYAYIVESVILLLFPWPCLLVLLTIPLAFKTNTYQSKSDKRVQPFNVLLILLTQLLFGFGFIATKLWL